MPYTPAQERAIAAKMSRQGKSRGEISAFFNKHGHTAAYKRKRAAKDQALKAMRKK